MIIIPLHPHYFLSTLPLSKGGERGDLSPQIMCANLVWSDLARLVYGDSYPS